MQIEWIRGTLGSDHEESSGAKDQVFDLASLTKVICTSSLLWDLVSADPKVLNESLSSQLPELSGTVLDMASLREFWEHQSGLKAHVELFSPPRALQSFSDRKERQQKLISVIENEYEGPSSEAIYSDLGFLLLGVFLERYHDKDLAELWQVRKENLGFGRDQLCFCPANTLSFVPTELRHPAGEVNDDNAFALGGVASHAGLFGTAGDVWQWLEKESKLMRSRCELWKAFQAASGRFVLGWDTPKLGSTDSHAGANASSFVRGHLGYTGTALWWDIKSNRAGVYLSNRVHPQANDENKTEIKRLRQEFFSELWSP